MKQTVFGVVLLAIFLLPLSADAQKHCNNKRVNINNDLTLEYDVCGERAAPAVLLIHGVTDSKHSWSEVAPILAEHFRVYVPSLRGHGDSKKPQSGYQIPVFADDMLSFMDKLKIESAMVAGHSLGSLVAHQMASVAPERVEKIVLIGSAPTLYGNAIVEYLWDEVVGLDSFTDPISTDFIREWQTGPNPVDEEFFETVVAETAKVPARVWKAAFRGLMTNNHSRFLGDIAAPTLIIWGDADPLIGREEQDTLLDAITGSTLVIFEDAGHNTHWEQPEETADDIVNFFLFD